MMKAGLLRYEMLRVGWPGLALPAIVALLFCGLSLMVGASGAGEAQISRVLVAGLELVLPLSAGFTAAHVVASEPALGLQLTLRTRYRATLARRLSVLTGWAALIAFAWALAMRLLGLWELGVPGTFLTGQLVWISPLLWFMAAGAIFSLLLSSETAGATLLAGIWIAEILLRGLFLGQDWLRPEFLFATTFAPGAPFWLSNRLALIATALLLGLGVWLLSSRNESLAKGDES
jgi:hypothetical protein